ncbi:MAG TPA: class II aldolase/adducin family protein [Caldilineaceae bacterium]|nr:class II aldolase/adducin family protein [Caldilineaceae bacterium]
MLASQDPRPAMVEIAHLLYERRLTNAAGGNLSCRVGDSIYITPRYLGSKHRWQLRKEMILVYDSQFQIVEGDPARLSREARMHFACYRNFPEVNSVIHAHPQYLTVFASAGEALPPVNQYTEKFGAVEVVPNLPSHSQELADAVVAALRPRAAALSKHGLGLILAWHGVAVVGRDLDDAYDTLERLEWSAQTWLLARGAGLELLGSAR